jgi:hypothetical protein
MEDLIGFGTLTRPVARFLSAYVRGRLDPLITRRYGYRQDDHAASNRMTRLGRTATPGAVFAQMRRRLDYAGNPP